MIGPIVGFLAALAVVSLLWIVGSGVVSLIRDPEIEATPAARLPIGLAVALGVLDGVGTVVPGRIAVWALVPLVAIGARASWQSLRTAQRTADLRAQLAAHWPVALVIVVATLIGCWPMFVAGRIGVAALTNDDATFYIDAADHLRAFAWRTPKPNPDGCLSNTVLHLWHWRVGVPWMMVALTGLTGLGTLKALALVTPVLFALVPVGAWWLARAAGIEHDRKSVLSVGLLSSISCAVCFAAFQDMTSQLGAAAIFPAAVGALALAVHRESPTAPIAPGLMLGLGVMLFADGASVLLVASCAIVLTGYGKLRPTLRRSLAAWVFATACFPVTFYRAGFALWSTLAFRVRGPVPVFTTRGWLRRSVLDDAGTLLGVDPWPPWASPVPPDLLAVAQYAGLLGAFALLALAAMRLRRDRFARAFAGTILTVLVVLEIRRTPSYLLTKVLLSVSPLVVPLMAVGAIAATRARFAAVGLYVLGVVASLSLMARPSHFTIVDGQAHDQLVTAIAVLPTRSLIVFDGFGAPADPVHDGHRALRAALRNGHLPLRSELDGGFYAHCPMLPLGRLPAEGFAVQRLMSERVSVGTMIGTWGPFALRHVDLRDPAQILATWTALTGWLEAERENDGTVFRWGARAATVSLRALTSAPCVRVLGEVRSMRSTVSWSIRRRADIAPIARGTAFPTWQRFISEPVPTSLDAITLDFVAGIPEERPDPERTFALRHVALAPSNTCGEFDVVPRAPGPGGHAALERLVDVQAYELRPGSHLSCARALVRVSHGPGRIGVRAGSGEAQTWTEFHGPGIAWAPSSTFDTRRGGRIELTRYAAPETPAWTVDAIRIVPVPCPYPAH